MDETIICTTNKWAFFGSTQTRGKKNDHIYHKAYLKYLIKFYDDKRIRVGKAQIPHNDVWTDNCENQHKCCFNFLQIAESSKTLPSKATISHNFAHKYFFKGPWDAYSKVIKARIKAHEMNYERIATALDCFLKLQADLSRTGCHPKMAKLFH